MSDQNVKNPKNQVRYAGFGELLRSFSETDPSRAAILCEQHGSKQRLTRKEFADAVWTRVKELTGEAGAAGAGTVFRDGRSSGTCLGILCDGSLDCVLTVFASALAGFQTVLLDENASEELLAGQIRQTDIDCLWASDEELSGELQPYLTEGLPPSESSAADSPDERRILFFTSGTTSSSKAVVLTDSSLMAAAYNGSCMLPLSPDDTLLCMLPLNHVFGFVCGLLWAMQCGAAAALGRGARYYTQDLDFFRPTALSAVPLLLGFLVQQRLINPELSLILVGAGDCPEQLLAAVMQQGVRVSFGYGLTETSSGVAISVPGSPSFDPFAMEICPENTVTLAPDGEILISSASCMMKGYYKNPEDTAAVLEGGVLQSGDLGRWDENGRLHVIGRKKEILVLPDGTKIFLPEYEARIAACLPGQDFTVLERGTKPVLLLVEKECAGWSEETRSSVRAALQDNLRGVMALLPRGQQLGNILFTDKPLPRTATGKVKRWELQQSGESPRG